MRRRGVTYDTGVLIAAERDERRAWLLHRSLLAEGVVPTVPTVVLAQSWRGGNRQARLSRLLAGCQTTGLDAERARSTGRLLAAAKTDDIVDAAVVEGAIRRGDVIVTGDPNDIAHLVQAAGETTPVRGLE